jgi:hypothetical protein
MKNDKVYVVFNNDMPMFYSFDEEEAEELAKRRQEKVNKNNIKYHLDKRGYQYNASYWHVHDVPALPDR